MKRRAWRTKAAGIESIVACDTRGKAAYRTLRQAAEAGYFVKFPEVEVHRAPEHDSWAEVDETRICWDEKLLPTWPEAKAYREFLAERRMDDSLNICVGMMNARTP